jgi:hypothetical protein
MPLVAHSASYLVSTYVVLQAVGLDTGKEVLEEHRDTPGFTIFCPLTSCSPFAHEILSRIGSILKTKLFEITA